MTKSGNCKTCYHPCLQLPVLQYIELVPKDLDDQINQWVSGYLFQIIGYVIDELIRRGTLRKPDMDKPLIDGVFYTEGKYIDP